MTGTERDVTERVAIFIVDNAFHSTPVSEGQYKALDALALRGQSGFLSTFTDSNDTVSQLIGTHYTPVEKLSSVLGPIKLAVLTYKSPYLGIGDIQSIANMETAQEIVDLVNKLFKDHRVIVVEVKNLDLLDGIVSKMTPLINSTNNAICAICGYGEKAIVPNFPAPPVVDPSWKIIGPDVVQTLSVEYPMLFITASKQLTRVDNVKFFSEAEFAAKSGMGVLPICQLFREFTYYTGSTWKYGA